MNTILITGGLGYLGGRVADYLGRSRADTSMRLTRHKSRPRPPWAKDFEIVEMDLLDPGSVAKALVDVQTVIHLAGLNEADSRANPLLAIDVNTKGTYHLMQCAARAGVRRVMYVSTIHVYGPSPDDVISERAVPDPVQPYAMTRLAAEQWVRHASAPSAIDSVVFRLSNGYGCPMDRMTDGWNLVFNDLCSQAVATGRIVLKSSGRQCRDFIVLDDVARAFDHFLAMAPGDWGHEVYNLGGERTMTVLDLAHRVASVYARIHPAARIPVVAGEDPAGSQRPRPFRYSIDKLRRTGFRLAGDMDREIERTLRVCAETAEVVSG